MVVRMTGSSFEYPGRNLGAAGFSLPGIPTEIQSKPVVSLCLSPGLSPAINFLIFFKEGHTKRQKLWPFLSIMG